MHLKPASSLVPGICERVELPSFRKEVCEADIMKVVENAKQKYVMVKNDSHFG